MARYDFVVGAEEAQLRLDRYLAERLPPACSRTMVQHAIRDGQVTIDGAVVKAHRRLKAGARVVADMREAAPAEDAVAPEPIPLDVVHEDADVLVVNKPPNLVTHPAPGHPSGTLVNAIAWHLRQGSRLKVEGKGLEPGTSNLEPTLPRAGLVHRLDKDTSGLLVVAKTGPALRELGKQLRARTMSRRYLALAEGRVPVQEGTIDVGVGRHLTHRKEMAVRYLGGRQAVTHYRVLQRCEVQGSRLQVQGALQPRTSNLERGSFRYTLIELQLETGRTHQIRVHLAHLGHPVLGDLVYGRHPASYWQARGIHRQLLHAYAIRFLHPTTQQPVELRIGLPEDMMQWTGRHP